MRLVCGYRGTMRIGLLSSWHSPTAGYIRQALLDRGVVAEAVIVDAKPAEAKHMFLWEERTGGQLPPLLPEPAAWQETGFHEVASHCAEEAIDLVRRLQLDLLINAGTPRILGERILAASRLGVLNVHPGLLPWFRGCTCVEWAVHLDEPVGNTVHFMTAGIDEGPIVLRRAYAFSPEDDYVAVRCRVYREGFALLAEAVRSICDEGTIPFQMQRREEGRYFKPIDDASLAGIKLKLTNGQYLYQTAIPDLSLKESG